MFLLITNMADTEHMVIQLNQSSTTVEEKKATDMTDMTS